MAFDGAVWSEAIPDDNSVANEIDDFMRDMKSGVSGRMAIEHIWPTAQTGTGQAGMHRFVTLQALTGAPTLAAASGQVGCVFVTSSGLAFCFENSAGTVTKIPTMSGAGTFGGLVVCSSASADAITVLAASADGYMLQTHSTTAAPTWVPGLGAWANKTKDTVYQATSDGFVLADGGTDVNISGLTDGSNPPTTERAHAYSGNVMGTQGLTMPVRKGDYWKVTNADHVYWIPLLGA